MFLPVTFEKLWMKNGWGPFLIGDKEVVATSVRGIFKIEF